MPFGIWYDKDDEVSIVDAAGVHMPLYTAKDKVRVILEKQSKEALLTALIDRLDVNDIVTFITDANNKFLEPPQEAPK